MKGERLFRILGLIDDDLVEEVSASFSSAARHTSRRRYLAAAACLALICTLSLGWLAGHSGGSRDAAPKSPEGASGSDGGSGVQDTEPLSTGGLTFMSYAGPVFPLTLAEAAEGVTAQRKTTWDFTPGATNQGSIRQWGAAVQDFYTLTNLTAEAITVTAAYPVAGSFDSLAEHRPSITVNGTETAWTLHAGSYAGGFTHAGKEDGSSWNLKAPGSWRDYKALLADGSYQASAFSGMPSLSLPVTVYAFTDFTAPPSDENIEQVFSCVYDKTVTTVLSYGFNSLWYDDPAAPGWYQYGYTANRAVLQEDAPKYLIVLGEDIRDTALRSLVKANNDDVLDEVFCTVDRYQSTLGHILTEICRTYREDYLRDWQKYPASSNTFADLSTEAFRDLAADQLLRHGLLSEDPKERYEDGRLDELISETLHYERVLYLTFPVTIPAGGSVTVDAALWKEPSFDFGCSDSDHKDLQGYDYVTTLASNLTFTDLSAALANTEHIEITGQNFGFDPENGIAEVTLDSTAEHYYLEIRPKA